MSGIDAEFMSRKKFLTLKLDLVEEFEHPAPFPESMFSKLHQGSSNQQPYVILGQKGTGKCNCENKYRPWINNLSFKHFGRG